MSEIGNSPKIQSRRCLACRLPAELREEVERDRMQRLNAPGEAPKAATEFLPYAIALEVREAWGDHLAEAFFATTTQR